MNALNAEFRKWLGFGSAALALTIGVFWIASYSFYTQALHSNDGSTSGIFRQFTFGTRSENGNVKVFSSEAMFPYNTNDELRAFQDELGLPIGWSVKTDSISAPYYSSNEFQSDIIGFGYANYTKNYGTGKLSLHGVVIPYWFLSLCSLILPGRLLYLLTRRQHKHSEGRLAELESGPHAAQGKQGHRNQRDG